MAEAAAPCSLIPELCCGLVLLSLLALVPLAGAIYSSDGVPYSDRLDLVAHGTLRGDVYVGESRGLGFPPYEQTFELPAGIEVKWARLYVGIWGGTERYEGWVQTTFNGHDLGKTALRGLNDENPHVYCSSHGVYWVHYDVTDMVVPGQNTGVADTSRGERGSKLDGRVYGIILVAVYEAEDAPETSFWVCNGNPSLHGKGWAGSTPSINDLVSVDFSGELNPANVNAGRVSVVYLAGNLGEPDYLEFNGVGIGGNDVANNGDGNTYGIDLKTFDVTRYVQAENELLFLRGKDSNGDGMIDVDDDGNLEGEYYLHPVLAVLAVEHKHAEHTTPDFVVTLDLANLTEGENTLHAVVSNYGRLYENDLKLTVFVDDSEIYSTLLPLDARGIEKVSIPWTAVKGAHTITAEIDPENALQESNEQNNVFSAEVQIGGNPDLSVRILTPVRERSGTATASGLVLGLLGVLFLPRVLSARRHGRRVPGVLVILGLLSVALVTSGCLDAQSGGEAPASGGMLKYSVPVEVTNEGEMPAADFALALYIDGEKSAITTIDRLQGGVSVTKTFSIAVTAGPHSLKAVVDEANKIKEPRRANNVDEITFTF
jgi:hypothetical protein